ncbi:MAG: phosphatase PAP2 family protein [Patescibacteria group bacterium]
MRIRLWFYSALISCILFAAIAVAVNSGGEVTEAIHSYDESIRNSVISHASPELTKIALFFTYLANPEVVAAVFIFLLILLFIVHEFQIIIFFLFGLAVGEGVIRLFKITFGRLRPEDFLAITQGGYAFPSGHAFAAAMFYGFVGHGLFHLCKTTWQRVLVILVTAELIIFIGLSRIVLGVHWPTDVLAGWLLGVAFLSSSIGLFHYFRNKNGHKKAIFQNKNYIRIGIIFTLLIFFIGYYYVTQSTELRSIGNSEVKQQ